MQFHIADKSALFRLIHRRERAFRTHGRQDREAIVVALRRQAGIALPVGRQTELIGSAFDDQQLIEVEQRIGQ